MIRHSLLRNILFALVGMLLTMIISFTLVADAYFRTGIDTLTRFMIRGLHSHYAPLIDRHEPFTQPKVLGFSLATGYEQIPPDIRRRVTASELGVDQLHVLRTPEGERGAPIMILMKLKTPLGHEVYYIRTVTQEMMSSENADDLHRSMIRLLLISLTAFFLSILILTLLYIATSRPLRHMLRWTRELGPESVDLPPPDFGYKDVNQLADLVQNSLRSTHQALSRERDFLRHASHELRTPLSVISSNLQLLGRFGPPQDDISRSVLERISRATNNMSQLSETLLWLGRKNDYQPESEPVQLDLLIAELIENNRYLLVGRDVRFESELSPCTLALPAVPCRIVLGNLIRNACQHTHGGVIRLQLSGCGEVEIRNDRQDEHGLIRRPDGFGLGLKLIGKLCDRFAWSFALEQCPEEWVSRVHLHMPDVTEQATINAQE